MPYLKPPPSNFRSMKIKGISLFLIALALTACNRDADKVNELESEVMGIHDEVMPKMDDIMSLKRNIGTKIAQLDSLQQEGVSSTTLAEQRLKALELNNRLSRADSLMMEWMYAYRGDSAKALPAGEAMEYFRIEKDKIVHVQELTMKSIQDAREFLK